jgi:hypothetical protein
MRLQWILDPGRRGEYEYLEAGAAAFVRAGR